MDGWCITALYFIGSLAATTIFSAFWCARDFGGHKLEVDDGEAAIVFGFMALTWLISIPIIIIVAIVKKRKTSIIEHAKYLLTDLNIDRISTEDRSAMIEIQSRHLKFLLKAHRGGYITLRKQTLELIRDELMHRNAERELLRSKD